MAESDKTNAGQIPFFRPEELQRRKKRSIHARDARRTLYKYTALAGGVAVMPVAGLAGQVAVGAVLVKLLDDLCRLYGVSFSTQQNKILIAAILGGAHYDWISRYLMKFTRVSPVVGVLLGPTVSGLLVYYIGKLFIVHLESGAWHAVAENQHEVTGASLSAGAGIPSQAIR